jgi:hypothetical protein
MISAINDLCNMTEREEAIQACVKILEDRRMAYAGCLCHRYSGAVIECELAMLANEIRALYRERVNG